MPSAPGCQDSKDSSAFSPAARTSKRWIASGLFFLVLAIYIVSSPGRIDLVDGQARYDVAYNWLTLGLPILSDPWIAGYMGVVGREGFYYAQYGPGGSASSIPLVQLGLLMNPTSQELVRFLFSLTSCFFGALTAVVLFLFYTELGVSLRKSFVWVMVSAFATLVWPLSTSSFDNAQHAFFAIAALYLGYLSAKRNSKKLALEGGLCAGVLILYQPYLGIVIPALALSTLNWKHSGGPEPRRIASASQPKWKTMAAILRSPQRWFEWIVSGIRGSGDARNSLLRYFCFLASVSVSLAVFIGYNHMRFGTFLDDGKFRYVSKFSYHLLGNPIAGLLTLLISPGKSVFLYSPPIIVAIMGIRHLWRKKPEIAATIVTATLILIAFLSSISFVAGDWCWGPRYLVILLPLWALAFPFVRLQANAKKILVVAIVAIGFLVQGMALSVEHQRFFFERSLNDFFWAEDPWAYFKHSALSARFGEILSLREGPPATARLFNAIPDSDLCTYTILGPPSNKPRSFAPTWIRNYKVFYLPRPWPLWMNWVTPGHRPINMKAWLYGLFVTALTGIAFISRGFRIGVPRHGSATEEILAVSSPPLE